MRKYKHEYTLCRENNPDIFKKACAEIEKIPELRKLPLLVDVDGSTIQVYEDYMELRIVVYDDYDIGVVFVASDYDLSKDLNTLIVS